MRRIGFGSRPAVLYCLDLGTSRLPECARQLAPHFLAREVLPANGCAVADGRFWFRSVKMAGYPIPTDGVVGHLLAASDRHPYRPAHLHGQLAHA